MGVGASVLCAIHCAAMPFVAVFLPMLGLSFLMDSAFHQVMVVVCSTIAICAFIPGLRRHRRIFPICVGVVGLSLISTAAFALEDHCCESCAALAQSAESSLVSAAVECTEGCCTPKEPSLPMETAAAQSDSIATIGETTEKSFLSSLTPWITSLGGLLLVAAHLTNRHFSCRCGCCPAESNVETIEKIA